MKKYSQMIVLIAPRYKVFNAKGEVLIQKFENLTLRLLQNMKKISSFSSQT